MNTVGGADMYNHLDRHHWDDTLVQWSCHIVRNPNCFSTKNF